MTTEQASYPRKVGTWTAITCLARHKRLRDESTPYIEGWAAALEARNHIAPRPRSGRLSRRGGDERSTKLVRPLSPHVNPPHRLPHAIVVSPGRGEGDSTYAATVRGHRMLFDQPSYEGGEDRGPTPVEVFVAGLLACVAHCASTYLRRHRHDRDGLRVIGEYTMADGQPTRIGAVSVRIIAPDTMPEKQRKALLAVAQHCATHNALERPSTIEITLADEGEIPTKTVEFDDSAGRRLD
jgi:putative redox protein